MAKVSICVLLYGDHPELARRCIGSLHRHCPRSAYQLIVGANAVSEETVDCLQSLHATGRIDQLFLSQVNLNKCPMMRRMFEAVANEWIWWFDDDSQVVEPGALDCWLHRAETAPRHTVLWGQVAGCSDPSTFAPELDDAVAFVRGAPWYRGLPPPSWRPGGKGEFDFEGRGTGDGRWLFVLGGCWLIRTAAVRALDWPDRRLIKMGDDVFLGEAVRQQGWDMGNIGSPGVAINTEPRRGAEGRIEAGPCGVRVPDGKSGVRCS